MEEMGRKIVNKLEFDESKTIIGYHKPPYNSIQHLHLHVAVKPISDPKHERSRFGIWMISNKLAIQYLEEYGSVLKGVSLKVQEESKDWISFPEKKKRSLSKNPKIKKKI